MPLAGALRLTGWLLVLIAAGSAIMSAVVLVEAASALGGPNGSMGILTVIIGGTMQLLWQAVAGTAMALLSFAAARLLRAPLHGANGP